VHITSVMFNNVLYLRVLTYRHKHVVPQQSTFKFGIKRNLSQRSLQVHQLI
jgi:hypothetical protein